MQEVDVWDARTGRRSLIGNPEGGRTSASAPMWRNLWDGRLSW
jgi:hypothetical protein